MIYNLVELDFSFSDMVQGMGASTRSKPGSVNDPNAIIAFVGTQKLLGIAVKAFQQRQYGSLEVAHYASYDEAYHHIASALESYDAAMIA